MRSSKAAAGWGEQTSDRPVSWPLIQIHTGRSLATQWLQQYQGQRPTVACVLGFTDTALIPGISAAGKTPDDRRTTAIADAEFLLNGVQSQPTYPLPPLSVGASPTFISRAILAALELQPWLFNAGLPTPPAVPCITVGTEPARCVSTGQALPRTTVQALIQQGWHWGGELTQTWPASGAQDADQDQAHPHVPHHYLVVGECVVGGTTTALATLIALGYDAWNQVNSSHPQCNHAQKVALVRAGLAQAQLTPPADPIASLAAVGDPMQCFVSGLILRVSQVGGVLLAGGTQMLAVYALARAIAAQLNYPWHPEAIVVGTTRWVATDASGDTVGLAQRLGDVPLLSTALDLSASVHPALRAYEAGFVKEGVGAGGCAIAAALYQSWHNAKLVRTIDQLVTAYDQAAR